MNIILKKNENKELTFLQINLEQDQSSKQTKIILHIHIHIRLFVKASDRRHKKKTEKKN